MPCQIQMVLDIQLSIDLLSGTNRKYKLQRSLACLRNRSYRDNGRDIQDISSQRQVKMVLVLECGTLTPVQVANGSTNLIELNIFSQQL